MPCKLYARKDSSRATYPNGSTACLTTSQRKAAVPLIPAAAAVLDFPPTPSVPVEGLHLRRKRYWMMTRINLSMPQILASFLSFVGGGCREDFAATAPSLFWLHQTRDSSLSTPLIFAFYQLALRRASPSLYRSFLQHAHALWLKPLPQDSSEGWWANRCYTPSLYSRALACSL
jgi:hypothetical protein